MPPKGSRAPKAKAKSAPQATADADQSKKRLNHKTADADAGSSNLTSALACLDKFKLGDAAGLGATGGAEEPPPSKVDNTSPAESTPSLLSEPTKGSRAPKAKSKSAPKAKADADQSKKRLRQKTTDADAGAASVTSALSPMDKFQHADAAEPSAVVSSKPQGLGAGTGADETPPTKVAKTSQAMFTPPPVAMKVGQDTFSKALAGLDNLAYRRPNAVA